MSEKFISIRNGEIGYPGKSIISDINIDIDKGQHWAIIGDSGSGKTSLLNVIAGNLQLRQGLVTRLFYDANNRLVDYHQCIAFVGAKPHFRNLSNTNDFYYQQRYNSSDSDDALTVADYLGTIITPPSAQACWGISNTMLLFDLTSLADKQIIKLSNGETKRLMLAAALLKNPQLLLLDNPLMGLDMKTREAFDTILTQIVRTGVTIVIATSSDEIPQIIDYFAI